MQRCAVMQAALAPNHQYDDRNPGWQRTFSTKDTETYECEREALVYEMFAQHFLQDAWSSGHMWHRWGRSEPSFFNYYLKDAHGFKWDVDRDNVPEANRPGRRAVIAGITASFVGMVHGTKAITRHAFPDKYGPAGNLLVWAGLSDDPLSAPFYFDLMAGHSMPVLWSDSQGNVAQGIGDLFVGAVLAGGDPQFQEEADRLRMCTGKSLREVYDAGPHAHGEPGAFSGRWPLDDFDIDAKCWSQRATNNSMVGSVLPTPLSYAPKARLLEKVPISVFELANDPIVDLYKNANSWALPDAGDRGRFFKSVRDRMIYDQMSVADAYLDNAMTGPSGDYASNREPFGTQSALGARKHAYEDSTNITFLDNPPNQPDYDTPPTKFMDPPEAIESGDAVGEGPLGVTSQLLRRMFWRAHPEDTCEVPNLVNNLRDQCIGGADLPGGDPEACTRCVEVAELQMPTCGLWGPDIDFVPSKCSSLGYSNAGGIDPIYYEPYHVDRASCFDTKTAMTPPYFAAFHYCTGTDPVSSYGTGHAEETAQLYGYRTLSTEQVTHFECAEFEDWYNLHAPFGGASLISPHDIKNERRRFAWAVDENLVEGNTWLPPIVSAQTEDLRVQLIDAHNICMDENPNTKQRVTSTMDGKLAFLVDPLPIWDNESGGFRNVVNDNWRPGDHQVLVEHCGVVQRATYANRSCGEVLPMLAKGVPEIEQVGMGRNAATGFEATEAIGLDESRCSVVEARQLKSRCYEGACDANGMCTARDAPDIAFAH
jgi:hypothetical protein